VFNTFEAICSSLAITGPALELGVGAGQRALLEIESLSTASRRIGVGLDDPPQSPGYEYLKRNAHDLSCFENASFEIVLSNSMLEHDARFWLTLAEAQRVLRPGGWLVVGVPGFAAMGTAPAARSTRKLLRILAPLPLVGARAAAMATAIEVSAPTLGLHGFPSDFYRFSEAAMREVLLEHTEVVRIHTVLAPPRFIGLGRVPAPSRHGSPVSP
jgi:SAM-dependent methyltransferase